jgi:hypothetical protein
MESSNNGLTRALLGCGLVAGPLYVGVSLLQALTRDGFDLTRHMWSLLSNGDLGWLQITNFLVTGVLTIACAAGMRRALGAQRGGTWGPVLVGVYGLGLIAAGCLLPIRRMASHAGHGSAHPRRSCCRSCRP